MTLEGLDIASHQGPNFPMDKAYAEGRRFVIIKASGGHSYRNPSLGQQVANARAAGMLVGFYHYQFEPSYGTPGNPSGGDVDKEVANFLAAIKPHAQEGDTCWLDTEEYPATVGFKGDLGGWMDTWCDKVSAVLGCTAGIYCATWYLKPTGLSKDARLAKWPFWMASWQDALPPKSAMAPWSEVTIWQYGAHNTVGGVRPIDEDRFFGDAAAWRRLGIGGNRQEEDEMDQFPAESITPTTNSRGEAIVVINYGGRIASNEGINLQDAGASWKNDANDIYDRSVKNNVFEPWVKRPKQDTGQ